MENIGTIAISLFLSITFLFWRLTRGHFKKEYSKKMWKQWGTRFFYWQGTIYTATGITFLMMCFLKWADV